jgi:pimeloyl-ACP methyl ester carboxylesterase
MGEWHRGAPLALPHRLPPTVVACGDLDVVIPPANAILLAQRWGAPAPTSYAGGGHAFMAQVPTDLAALLAARLAP